MKMKILGFFIIIAIFTVASGCTKGGSPAKSSRRVRVGLVLDKGGKDDKSFNAAAYKGASEASKDFGIDLKTIESPDDNAYEPAMRQLSERGYNLVIVVGFSQADPIKKIAPLFPKTHFAIIDADVDILNVASLIFSEHEGSFLVGYIAGLKTETKTVGFIGGMDVDLIKRFELGYREGVAYANSKVKVIANYAGVTSEAWMNPTKGKELALAQIGQGADIIFAVAGATNQGVFDAVEDKKKLAIGVDSNENWVKPGFILTSMMKRVDLAVYNTIKAEKEGRFVGGDKFFGLADKGVDYALDKYNENLLSPDLLKKVEAVKADIIKGKIQVSDYYLTRKLCPSSPFKCDKSRRTTEKSGQITQ